MKNKVLILTDFTPVCYDSVTYGLDFCGYYGFEAEILHISYPGEIVNEKESKRILLIAELYDKKFGIGAKVVIREGNLQEVIKDEAKSGNFSMIILGTHGRHGFQSVTGSMAAKIVLNQEVPVLVVQSKIFNPIERVVLPVADSSIKQCEKDLAMLAELTKILDTKVEIATRSGEIIECNYFKKMFGYDLPIVLRTKYEKERSFSKQVVDYCEKTGVDMILMLSSDTEIPKMDTMLEQMMFNLPQIPVTCK